MWLGNDGKYAVEGMCQVTKITSKPEGGRGGDEGSGRRRHWLHHLSGPDGRGLHTWPCDQLSTDIQQGLWFAFACVGSGVAAEQSSSGPLGLGRSFA